MQFLYPPSFRPGQFDECGQSLKTFNAYIRKRKGLPMLHLELNDYSFGGETVMIFASTRLRYPIMVCWTRFYP